MFLVSMSSSTKRHTRLEHFTIIYKKPLYCACTWCKYFYVSPLHISRNLSYDSLCLNLNPTPWAIARYTAGIQSNSSLSISAKVEILQSSRNSEVTRGGGKHNPCLLLHWTGQQAKLPWGNSHLCGALRKMGAELPSATRQAHDVSLSEVGQSSLVKGITTCKQACQMNWDGTWLSQ